MSNDHPIPKALRDRFDQIERDIMGNKMERSAVFTQMRTAVQAYFMSAEPVDAIPLSDCVPGWHSDYNDGLFATDDTVVKLYRHPPEVERLRAELEWVKALNGALHQSDIAVIAKQEIDTLRAKLAERDALFADVLSIDVPRTAKALDQMRAILSASAEPIEPACCTPTAEEKALLENGDYTPEELWGASKPSCPKCHKAEQVVWIGMEDLPEYAVGARYRIILDDVRQECTELEKEDGKRWFRGDDSGTFPIDEIQAWLPIAEPANKEGAQ